MSYYMYRVISMYNHTNDIPHILKKNQVSTFTFKFIGISDKWRYHMLPPSANAEIQSKFGSYQNSSNKI